MISVDEALDHLLALAQPLTIESVPLIHAAGRILAQPVSARRDQPPFDASSMDGYAINAAEAELHAQFKVIGESAAGHRFEGRVGPGQAVRIFTGAPLPECTDFVVIQEDVERAGALITITDGPGAKANLRRAGADFAQGTTIEAPRRLSAQDIALLASMNIPEVTVTRKPQVALISTGDELVLPGEDPGPDQIIASNTFGQHAMLQAMGAHPRILPIARDTKVSLKTAFDLAQGADLVITIGGASVGDHDMVGDVARELGMEQSFYKVAMRPGKPLMAGRLGQAAMIGLPGNPVSAMVCGHVFVAPVIARMLGLGDQRAQPQSATLADPIGPNGPRTHYMRAVVKDGRVTAFDRQDSSLLSVLAQANALLIRPAHDSAKQAGAEVSFIPI